MLIIYETMVSVIAGLRPVVAQNRGSRPEYGASAEAGGEQCGAEPLEGSGSSAGTRRERYRNALGSARETGSCLDVALAFGYVEQADGRLLDALDKVRATLVKVAV